MKSWISLILAVIFLSSVLIFNIREPKVLLPIPQIKPIQSPTPTPIPALATTDCHVANLKGTIAFEGAAGSSFGTVRLTNTSTTACDIHLNTANQLQLSYLPTIKNIIVTKKDSTVSAILKLYPNASLYGMIKLQNGPQCHSGITQVQASLSYQIGDQPIIFTTQNKPYFMINSCSKPDEMTKVDISSLSIQPGP